MSRSPALTAAQSRSVQEEAADLFETPDEWLETPNPALAGRSPNDCLGSDDEEPVRELLWRMKYVPYS